jgi:hypothetical protein
MRNIDLNVGIDRESLSDLLSVALSGCDWLRTETLRSEDCIDERLDPSYRANRCLEDKWADRLLLGGHLVFYDLYDEDDNGEPMRYELDIDDFNRGLRKAMTKECPYDWADFVDMNDDYYTGNNLIQVCIFGRVIYG